MKEEDMAVWQTWVEEMTCFVIIDTGMGNPFLT